MRDKGKVMVLETIIIGFVCVLVAMIVSVGAIIGITTYKTIALGLATIAEDGKNVRERINVRADMNYDSNDDGAEASGTGGELDGIARMLGYDSVGSALTSPELMKMLGLNKQPTE